MAVARQIDVFTATALQTAFPLSETPLSSLDIRMTVNGVDYTPGVDFAVIATSLTWNDVPFTLGAGDSVLVNYQF